MSEIQRKTAKTKLVIRTTTVAATTSSFDGKDTFRISRRVSARKSLIFLIHPVISAPVPRLDSGEIDRPGGIRTPNPRFWRPMLYQFELLACFTGCLLLLLLLYLVTVHVTSRCRLRVRRRLSGHPPRRRSR